jgi:hypothetical protein
MDVVTVQTILESGSSFGFALLVWWELRQMRTEMLSILNRLDERTKTK